MYSFSPQILYKYFFFCLMLFVIPFNLKAVEVTEDPEGKKDIPQLIEEGEIALSLDDAPMPSTVIFTGLEKTKRIIQALRQADCPAIGVFAVGQYTKSQNNIERLRMYGEAGHIIANHSYSHYKLNNVTTREFITDVKKAHDLLCELPNFRPWFRFPYLAEGKDSTQRGEVIEFLQSIGYREGYITVNNHDYYINKLLLDAVKAGKVVDYEKLKNLYIRIIWDCITSNQKLAYKVLKRKVKHVLLLHENDLAALFLGDLIAHIRKQGWKIISIEEAYQDPIADIPITNTYSLVGRLGAIAIEKGLDKKLAVYPETVEYNYIPEALKQQQVFTNPNSPSSHD